MLGDAVSHPSSLYSSQEKLVVAKHCIPSQVTTTPQPSERRSRMSSSNNEAEEDCSQLLDDCCCSSPVSSTHSSQNHPRQPKRRTLERARSLSCSPSSSLLTGGKNSDDAHDLVLLQNERFKDIFPKACKQMEENLSKFIEQNKIDLSTVSNESGAGISQNDSQGTLKHLQSQISGTHAAM